jgi:hypothetical protein
MVFPQKKGQNTLEIQMQGKKMKMKGENSMAGDCSPLPTQLEKVRPIRPYE